MCSFIFGFLISVCFLGVIFYETLRWVSIREECFERRENHNKLIASDVCKKGYGENVEAMCSKAHIELRTPIAVWTSMEWWKRGEINHLYTRLTESYISIFLLVLIPILYIIYKTFDAFKQKDIDDRVERMLRGQQLMSIPYIPQEYEARDHHNPRRKSSHFISGPKDF